MTSSVSCAVLVVLLGQLGGLTQAIDCPPLPDLVGGRLMAFGAFAFYECYVGDLEPNDPIRSCDRKTGEWMGEDRICPDALKAAAAVVDPCEGNQCDNGATCVTGSSDYTCQCATGYTGPYCQSIEDNCTPSPCINSVRCNNALGSYTCDCQEGYTGINCEYETCSCRIRGDPVFDRYDKDFCILGVTPQKKVYTLTKYRMTENDRCSFMVEVGTSHPVVDGKILRGADEPRYINVWFNNVIMRFDQGGVFEIAGVPQNIPYNDASGNFSVRAENSFLVMKAPACGIQVGFDGKGLASVATVKVPSTLGEELTGLCGNCDGSDKDMKTADGIDVGGERDGCKKLADSFIVDDSYEAGFQ